MAREKPPRFKIGDTVFLVPRYAQLFSGDSAVVVDVVADPFRPAFNDYTVKFSDGSVNQVFEFQLVANQAD